MEKPKLSSQIREEFAKQYQEKHPDTPENRLKEAYAQHKVVILTFHDGRPSLRGRLYQLDLEGGVAEVNFEGRGQGGAVRLEDVKTVEIEEG